MPISNSLMFSILAMDSYNRGYSEGIEGLGGIGSKVGSATLGFSSSTANGCSEIAT